MGKGLKTWVETSEKKVILTFEDFKNWCNESPHQRTVAWWKIDWLRVKLESSDYQIKDPIVFLHDLYFEKCKSFRKILDESIVDNFYSVKWLRNLLVNSFWWSARLNTERTPAYDEVEEKRVESLLSEVWNKVWETLDVRESYSSLSIRKLRSLDSRLEKVLYIFEYLLWLTEESLLETFQTLEYWKKRVTTYMNKVIKDALDDSWKIWVQYDEVELNHWIIESWLRLNSNKWEARIKEAA